MQKASLHPVCCLRFVSDWTRPLDILSADIVNCFVITYQQKGAWATRPLEQILDSELLLCELGVVNSSHKWCRALPLQSVTINVCALAHSCRSIGEQQMGDGKWGTSPMCVK